MERGCVTDGAAAGQPTPVYYLSQATNDPETYWVFTEISDGYFSIKNSATGEYVTYDGVRKDVVTAGELRRYISMTPEMEGEASLWTVNKQQDGVYNIRNAQQTDHIWDVRTDSYCVGTYSNNGGGNNNQLFSFYDEGGNIVKERAQNDTGNGFDVSSWFVATTEASEGWKFNGEAWGSPSYGDYWGDDGIAHVVIPFLERWNASSQGPLPNQSVYQTIDNIPAGSYTLQADIIAVRQSYGGWWQSQSEEVGHGVFFNANGQRVEVGTYDESPKRVSLNVTLTKMGGITFGIEINSTNANWVAFDNIRLLFNGTEEAMIAGEKEKVRTDLLDYYSESEIDVLMSSAGDDFEALEKIRKNSTNGSFLDPLARGARDITIDGRAIIYVESLDLYLCTLPLEKFNYAYNPVINYTPREGYGKLLINNTTVEPGANYDFHTIRPEAEFTFSVKTNEGKVTSKKLTFTSLPVVKMYGTFNNNYSQGSIIVHEPDKEAPQLLNMKAKWRGGITNGSGKHKRNYHVKLLDENGEKLEQKFFGLRNDNSWILESCQVDMSRIRNRVLTDIWNAYSASPYYINKESKAMTGTRGRFVELILNNEYRGIYCMTENVDRKQMKLKKYDEDTETVHGQLWKSKDWSYATFMGTRPDGGYYPKDFLSDPNEYSDMWDSYQVKYPDFEDYGNQTDWTTLYDAVDFVCHSTDNEFREHFSEYFDMPVVIDYYILMETILSTDNHGKNMFFAVYDKQEDKKITFAVWDMDATCGQRWSDEYYHQAFLGPVQDYSQFITRYEHGDYNLFRRLRNTDVDDFNMRVRLRYRELRENHLATESILKRFRTQLDEFKTAGAAQREYDRWSRDSDVSNRELNFDVEMDYLDDWFTRRMEYLDTKRFDIASLPSDITGIATKEQPSTNGIVFDLKGQRVATLGTAESLPSGVYILNGKKIVKK